MKRTSLIAFLAILGSAWSPNLSAQESDVAPSVSLRIDTGGSISPRALGAVVAGPFDLETGTGDNQSLGVEEAWGFWWVTSRDDVGSGGSGPGPTIYQYDLNFNLIASYDQTTNSPVWGHRDLAADEANNLLYAGDESGELHEYLYDPNTQTISHQQLYVINTTQTIRALARNPNTGTFFSGDFGSNDIIEFDLTGNVLNSWTNPGVVVYGMAWDTQNDTIWLFGQDDNGTGNQQHFEEFDPTTFEPTCREFWGVPNPGNTNIAGGCDFYNDSRNPNGWTLVALHQTVPDALYLYDAVGPAGPPAPYFATVNLPAAFVSAVNLIEGFEAYGGVVPSHMAVTETNAATGLPDVEAWCNIGQRGPTNGGASGNPPRTGTYALEMGLDPNSTNNHDVRNALVIGLDGGGNTELFLDFWVTDHGEETDGFDGVWISSNGAEWYQIYGPWTPITNGSWQEVAGVSLLGGVCGTPVDISGQFYMMISQEDNFPLGNLDGIQIDDIRIYPPELTLTNVGPCPGPDTFSISNATPNGVVALAYAFQLGNPTVPAGPCGNVTLDIGPLGLALAATVTADSNGDASVPGIVPVAACGVVHVQALDLTSCELSNVVSL